MKQDAKEEVVVIAKQAAQEIVGEIVKEAILEALEESQASCCSGKCKERCGLTQSEHYESHKRINEFFGDLADMTRSMRSTIVKIIITVLIGATILGLGIKVEKVF